MLACQSITSNDKIIGVKIYDHPGEFEALIEEWKSIGINSAFVSKELLSNPEFRALAKENDIPTFVILPIFFDEHLDTHPEDFALKSNGETAIDEWVKFACPSNEGYRRCKIDEITQLVKEHNPDGISIDFIRHFVFWEKVAPDTPGDQLPNTCFCNSCLSKFSTSYKINLPEISATSELSKWILQNHQDKWSEWKCELITSMIRSIVSEAKEIKPEILVNVHIVPWRQTDFNGAIKIIAGQDVESIAPFTDYLSPMTYSHMVKQNSSWVHEVVQDIHSHSQGEILPSIQVKEAYLTDSISSQEFSANLKMAFSPPSKGVIFWSWEHLQQDYWKKEIIKELVLD